MLLFRCKQQAVCVDIVCGANKQGKQNGFNVIIRLTRMFSFYLSWTALCMSPMAFFSMCRKV